jgi:AcrR family transcriptional regulator
MRTRLWHREFVTVAAVVGAQEAAVSARDRLLAGLAASIKERGYRETKISDIVAHARTSRRTFYEVFETKDDCFLALLHEANQRLIAHITASVDPTTPWDVQVEAGITAWIESIAAEPEIGISWIREFPSLGTRAADAQRAGMRELSQLLKTLTSNPQMRAAGIEPVSSARAAILLGGLRELAAGVAESGGDIHDITDEAVAAAQALLGPKKR